jgi:hypothetical protein
VTDQEIDTVEQEFDQAWEQAVPAQDFPLPPPSGWLPKDFPHLTVDLVPYSTNAFPRADPYMTITPQGWLYVEVGNYRLAIPDQEEWDKFVYMITCLWNSFALAQQQAAIPQEGESDERETDQRERVGQAALPDHDQPEPRGGGEAALPSDPESG